MAAVTRAEDTEDLGAAASTAAGTLVGTMGADTTAAGITVVDTTVALMAGDRERCTAAGLG
jgi:hypothetical protein